MKFIKTALFIVGVIIVINILDDETNTNDRQTSSKPLKKTETYAARTGDNTWPNIDDTQASVIEQLSKRNYYLVFDGSGSMNDAKCSNGDAKINVAKTSVKNFISKIPGDANIGLLVFDVRGVYERAILGSSSKDSAIKEIGYVSAGGGTPLKSSIDHAYKALTKQAVKQLGYGEYHLVVVTDGEASAGEDPGNVVNDLINKSPVVLHTIGFCIGDGHSLNQKGMTLYKAANNPQELAKGLESVLAEASDFNVDSFEGQVQ